MKSIKILFPALLLFFLFPIVNGQELATDAMVANWNFSPKAEVSIEKFEDFLQQDYIPALENNMPGVKFFLLKNDRGNDEGGYSILVIFKSIDARNEWWPKQGESTDKAKKAMEKMKEQGDQFDEMATITSWNDWLVL